MPVRIVQMASLLALVAASGRLGAQELPPPRVLPPQANPQELPRLPPPRLYLQPAPPLRVYPLLPPPAPRLVTMPGGATYLVRPDIGMPMAYSYYRPSAYQIWQYYGVTYPGYFRPRVINTANSGYYVFRGLPFPWVNNYPVNQVMPFPLP